MKTTLADYRPLIVIAASIALAALALSASAFSAHEAMRYFMGLFFLVFAMFKLFDVQGFVKGFAMYDLVAKRVRAYGYAYPFAELLLALLYLSGAYPLEAAWATLALMLVSAAGVLSNLRAGMDTRCACLGTLLNVPLSTVSVVENLGMAAMAAWMLL